MSYRELVEKVVSEDAVAGVTANDGNTTIDYLPDGFISAKDWFRRKSQLKKKWKLKVLDSKEGRYELNIGGDIIRIPKQHYQHFNEKVINVVGKTEIDLTPLLEEAQNEEVAQLNAEIEKQIKGNLLLKRAITQTIIIRNSWLANFPNHTDEKTKAQNLIDLNNYEASVTTIIGEIKETYGADVGELELLLKALEEGDDLAQFAPFSRYQGLLGCKIKSNYEDVLLTLILNVDMSLIPNQSIEIQSEKAEELISEMSRYGVKISKNKIYPSGWMFVPRDFMDLKKEIRDLK